MKIIAVVAALVFLLAGSEAGAADWVKKSAGRLTHTGSLALDAAGNPHLSYTLLKRRGDANFIIHEWFTGKRWKKEPVAEAPGFLASAIAIDGGGTIHIVYSMHFSGTDRMLRHATSSGEGWTVSDIEESFDGMSSPLLATAPDGTIHLFHHNGTAMRHGRFDGAAWSLETVPGTGRRGTITAGFLSDGTPVVAWGDSGGTSVARRNLDGWEGLPGLPGAEGVIAVAPDDSIHALYTVSPHLYSSLHYGIYGNGAWSDDLLIDRHSLFGETVPEEFTLAPDRSALRIDSAGRPHLTFELGMSRGRASGTVIGYAFRDDGTWYAPMPPLGGPPADYTTQSLTLDGKGIPHLVTSLTSADYSTGIRYARLSGKRLAVSLRGKNRGTVASDLPGISCGTDCSDRYFPGTAVTLTATPADGYRFVRWGGACSGESATCTVTMEKDRSVRAVFAK